MQAIQVGKFKSSFSSILEQVEKKGEEFIIEYGKKHKKIAIVLPYKDSSYLHKKRKLGQLRGKIKIPPNFNDESNEIIQL